MLVKVVLRRRINIIHKKKIIYHLGEDGDGEFRMCHDKIYFLPSLAVAGLSISIVVRGTEISI